ncbi:MULTISPECIES: polysaccharide biosynthesis protein [Stenotrophomonas]|jgi:FlaA1/EpsC-like NDP-sugar epimerase|uniref:polysaccharide biosynthesis protein n=1 Tax=Stenotrophomonas TaxID=40323 RepID=UPI00070257F8|nr:MULTISPECIES: nucleoside-diphosphate sugar epimerase/dehydratase [Stenotrophomonas]KRG85383.1 multidrug MFS transporter [Stenotrophomonas acidaminiphila]OZB53401.1 MAG: polysaccharide biosynthesis protein [Stenotrophomonas sp. 14-69-23]QOF97138.1 polysaccharide biosynthesis protein [Stenotrophomonas sp. CW117]
MAVWRQLAGNFPRIAVMLHDLVMVWACWQLLHVARYAMLEGAPVIPLISFDLVIVMLLQAMAFHYVGLYRGLWRFASVTDLVNIFKACFIGMGAIVLVFSYRRLNGIPMSVLAIYPFALAALLGGPRLLYRAWKDYQSIHSDARARRVLVLGAGHAAEALVKDLRRSGDYEPVGLLDDSPHLKGAKLQGIPILGTISDVASVARETAAKLLVIAIPTLDAAGMQRIVALCESTGLPFRTVPRLSDVLEGNMLPGQLKEVAIEDLLGRKPIQPDWALIRGWLRGRTVMVTGAGGSIGSELCRQCARHGAGRIVLLEISEILMLNIQSELCRNFPHLEIECVLGDCGDPAVARRALGLYRPDTVFHAAAYKQVPLLEGQMREAIRNNTLATECMARACQEHGVDNFVFISTDKAVDPANALGATKRYAEMICQSLNEKKGTRFVTVRFGNVLGSVGSVVPLFREQIRKGGPVTVTHPEVSRYFMTIPEACLLILQAAASSSRGAIYMLDMGEPVLIRVLAEQMIRLAGHQPGTDIAIVYTGLRAGEKLHESLFYSDENSRPTAHPKVLEAGVREFSTERVLGSLPRLREAVAGYDVEAMQAILSAVIPEYSPLGEATEPSTKTNIVPFPKEAGRN